MALIKCPECGKDVSDKAEVCLNCGFQIAGTENIYELAKKKEEEIVQENSEKNKSILGVVIAIVGIVFFVIFVWYTTTSDERALERSKQELQEITDSKNEIQEEIEDLERQIEYNEYLIDEYESD